MDGLVERLSQGEHSVVASRVGSAAELQQCIERGYVLIMFVDRWGGVELGIKVDKAATDLNRSTGTIHLEGDLPLPYTQVRCVADIDLATLEGTGHLEVQEEKKYSQLYKRVQ